MNQDWVPIEFPDNFDEMLTTLANSADERADWCMLCNGPTSSRARILTIARPEKLWMSKLRVKSASQVSEAPYAK